MLILDLWKKQQGEFFFLSTKSMTGRWKDYAIHRDDLQSVKQLIQENSDKNIYMCPHGFSSDRRHKSCSVDPSMLYADLDECDPRTLKLRPTIALESSPGRYVGFWLTDRQASEGLNQRLAYTIGADVSGWDRTQVLRVPNTRNYKYPSAPRVKILWADGPKYRVANLEKEIPQISQGFSGEVSDETAADIYRAYESKLPRWARKEVFATRVSIGKRSEVLWKLHHAFLDAGMTRDEAFQVLWASSWNKFRDRRNGDEQLRRELDKALSQKLDKGPTSSMPSEDQHDWDPLPAPISEIEEENINWDIPGMLARKELAIVEGDPGLGKSYFVQMIAGLICDGKPLPFMPKYQPSKGKVVYFDTENTASTVTKSRLVENGVENLHNYYQGEDPFGIDDEEKWEAVLNRIEQIKPRLVVFDTINTYIGSTDTYRSSETQQAMAFFKEIAVRFDCSVVILRHLTKGGKDKAIYRGQGSIAFTGAARIVMTVGRVPDDPDIRVVACTKNNISTPFKSFTYTIQGLPDTLKRKNRSKLIWGDFIDLSSDEILAPPTDNKNKDKEEAIRWLTELLGNEGRVESHKIERMADKRAISKTALNRAADELGIIKDQEGYGRSKIVWWSLPQED